MIKRSGNGKGRIDNYRRMRLSFYMFPDQQSDRGMKITRVDYSLRQSLLISSRVFPFVSGTSFHTKIAARIQIAP